MQKILAYMWPYNFLHFSQQYTVHIMDRREKNRPGFFSCMRVWITASPFSLANMYVYIIGSPGANGCGSSVGSWRLESTTGISCLGLTQTRLKSAQMARHGYDTICAHNLRGLYHIDKLPTDSYTLFDDGKMCERTQISHEKCDDISEYSYEKCEWCWLWC